MAFSWIELDTITGAQAVFQMKTLLKAQGWTVPSSSDGTTYNASGDQITHGGSGANGMANNLAWFRIRTPDGVVEYTWQRTSTNTPWRVKSSPLAKFTGGSPGATQTPSATDEGILLGGGTDAAPSFETVFGTDNTYRYKGGADNATPYNCWFGAFPIGGGATSHFFVHEGLTAVEPTDGAPYHAVIGVNDPSFGNLAAETESGSGTRSFATVAAVTPASWQVMNACIFANTGGTRLVPANLPTNPISVKDESFPIPYGRRNGVGGPGWKGIGTMMRWNGTVRTNGDTFTVSTTRDRIIYGEVNVPWNGTVPTV